MSKQRFMSKQRKAFTLIELLTVISIIGLLISIIIVTSLLSARAKARDTKRQIELKELAKALEIYFYSNNIYPQETKEYDTSKGCGTANPSTYTGTNWCSDSDLKILIPNYASTLPLDPINNGDFYYYFEPYDPNDIADSADSNGTNYAVCFQGQSKQGSCSSWRLCANKLETTNQKYCVYSSNKPETISITEPTPIPPTPTPIPTYTLTVNKSGSGTITSSPSGINCGTDCTENYSQGTRVTLTATPASGYTFAGWSGACSGTGTCTLTMDSNKSVTATFSSITYTLTVTQSAIGIVTSSPPGINCGMGATDCTENYSQGTQVTLTATPASEYIFTGWSGDCSGTGTCTLTMDSNKSVTARFDRINYTLTVSLGGTGGGVISTSGSIISCEVFQGTVTRGPCSASFPSGSSVELVPNPKCSTFVWSGGPCSGTGRCSLIMNSNITVSGTFTASTCTLSVEKFGPGSGTIISNDGYINCGTSCSHTYNFNTKVKLTAIPDSNSIFISWNKDSASPGPQTNEVTMLGDIYLSPYFDRIQHTSYGWKDCHWGEGPPWGVAVSCGGTNVTMGLNFGVTQNVKLIKLCGFFYNGTYLVKLLDFRFSVLASAYITSNFNWSCTDIPPIYLQGNELYYLVVDVVGGGRGCIAAASNYWFGFNNACNKFYVAHSVWDTPAGTFDWDYKEEDSIFMGLVDIVYHY